MSQLPSRCHVCGTNVARGLLGGSPTCSRCGRTVCPRHTRKQPARSLPGGGGPVVCTDCNPIGNDWAPPPGSRRDKGGF